MRRHPPIVIVALLLIGWSPPLPAAVRGWRGDSSGVYPEATPPLSWSPEQGVAWRVAMPGPSCATPVLIGERLIVMADPNLVICLDAASGEELWRRPCPREMATLGAVDAGGSKKPNKVVGRTCCTPVTDGESIFCLFHSGLGVCLDLAGEPRWARRIAPVGKGYGQSMSPALVDGVVAVHIDDTLYGLDLASGEERWTQAETQHQGSPVGIALDGAAVVLGTDGGVYRAADGQRLTKMGFPALNKFNTPVVRGDTAWWVSEGKFLVRARFVPDGEGGVRVKKGHHNVDRGVFYASVLVYQDKAYLFDNVDYKRKRKNLRVLDLSRRGKTVFRRPIESTGWAYPSPAGAGGFVFVSTNAGACHVFLPTTVGEMKPRFSLREVCVNSIGEAQNASPVFAGDRLYLRGDRHLYCFQASEEDRARAARLLAGEEDEPAGIDDLLDE